MSGIRTCSGAPQVADFRYNPSGAVRVLVDGNTGMLYALKNDGTVAQAGGAEGPPGPQGPQGVQGDQGIQGVQGPAGADGAQGPAGADGQDGAQGPQGIQGIQGIQGPQGDAGAQGAQGNPGQGVPTGGTQGQVLAKTSAADYATAWTTPSADPWTYLRLAADFTTTSNTAVNVTGLAFTPAANTRYEFEASIGLRTATATVNPRAGLAWPTGMSDGWASIEESQSATAQIMAFGNINAALLCAVGGLPNTTQTWPASIRGTAIAGATPSGDIRVQLASETNGTTVRAVAGSWLKYRTVP